jgi:HEAT repeat protein
VVAQKISHLPKLAQRNFSSWRAALVRVMLCLALCLLVGGIAPIAAAAPGDDSQLAHRTYARQANGILFSDDAGLTWTEAGALPSRPLALAAAGRTPGLVFVGTESLGLMRSNDGGALWQPVNSRVLGLDLGAPVAVTALAIDPEDEQIVYAATNVWLGSSTAHLTPWGVAVSVDGGRQWLQLSRSQLGDLPLQRLTPVGGHPLTVVTVNGAGSQTVSLAMSPALLGLLQDADAAVRASAARAIGLTGDPAALPALLKALADPDALTGQRIAEAIGRIGDPSASAYLLQVLTFAPSEQRSRAALALGMLKSPASVPGLAALLNTGEPGAQRVAAAALAAIGTPAAMDALMAPLADAQLTPARRAAMGGLETTGQSAVAPLIVALLDDNPVIRANAAQMLGWLQPIGDLGQRADTVAGLARLLTDPELTAQTQATWALGEMDTEAAHLALNARPVQAAPILPQPASRPVGLAPPAALPGAITDVAVDDWTIAIVAALLVLVVIAMLAVVLTLQRKRLVSHLGHS